MFKSNPFCGAFAAFLCVVFTIFFPEIRAADETLGLPAIFGDHMVLQQGVRLPIWGKGTPGQWVKVSLGKFSAQTEVNTDGHWRVDLEPQSRCKTPTQLKIESGKITRTVDDVLIGEVWVCSGQSNMALGVGAVKDSKQVIEQAKHPELRLFLVQRQVSFEPAEDLEGEWIVCSPETLAAMKGGWKGFSAVGYFFGVALQEAVQSPVGLIGTYVGGTNLYSWAPLESLLGFPDPRSEAVSRAKNLAKAKADLARASEEYETKLLPEWNEKLKTRAEAHNLAMADWKAAVASAKAEGRPLPPRPQMPNAGKHPQNPKENFHHASVLFNGMMHPLIPYAIAGMIWYQGEANAYPGMAEEYRIALPRFIHELRSQWGQGNFPFLVVQLPNLESEKETWPVLRDSQEAVWELPQTGLAITWDAGDPKDLHPIDKLPIGERLALLARRVAYDENVLADGPRLETAVVEQGKIKLTFANAGTGLMTGKLEEGFRAGKTDVPLGGFEVIGETGGFVPANAKIEGSGVVVECPAGMQPVFVRFAWAPDPSATANLYNEAGLPAAPFLKKLSP